MNYNITESSIQSMKEEMERLFRLAEKGMIGIEEIEGAFKLEMDVLASGNVIE